MTMKELLLTAAAATGGVAVVLGAVVSFPEAPEPEILYVQVPIAGCEIVHTHPGTEENYLFIVNCPEEAINALLQEGVVLDLPTQSEPAPDEGGAGSVNR